MNTETTSRISIKNILLAAIGGQGGNVLIEWLFLAAERDGRRAQALSLPGLSQRGGGTNFYLEIASLENPSGNSEKDAATLDQTLFAQFPFPGRVDVLLGQELVELGRLIQAGYASRRTSVVASSQRIYTIDEKMDALDGRFPAEKIIEAAAQMAGSLSIIDTAELAKQNNLGDLATNAILLGALSAVPEALPMPVERYREAIREFGLAVEMNLKAFEVGREYQLNFNKEFHQIENRLQQGQSQNVGGEKSGLQIAQTIPLPGRAPVGAGAADSGEGAADGGSNPNLKKARRQISLTQVARAEKKPAINIEKLIESREKDLPVPLSGGYRKMAEEVVSEWPESLHATLVEALYQMADYQNLAYARRYLKQVEHVLALEPEGQNEYKLTHTYAKTLAMRMTYEDAVRVASLKIKPGRLERIRRDMAVKPGQVLHVTDYLKPDAAEIYGIFPNFLVSPMLLLGKVTGIGYWLGKKHFTLQLHPKTTTLGGYMTFRFLTGFKPFRVSSHRFHYEWKLIQELNKQLERYAGLDYELALLIAESGRMVKGYGDTRRKMIKTMERYYTNVIAPLVKLEERAKPEEGLAGFTLSQKAGRLALQLIGRNDEGIDRAESLVKRIQNEAKGGMPRREMLDQLEKWAKS
jgi:indolepyruvate ferredoxin oxidoreductase beta subunit